jgi:hypothetical protein
VDIQEEQLSKIRQLCDKYKELALRPNGSVVLTAEHNKLLITRYFEVPNLSLEVLQEIPVYLTQTLAFSRGNVIITQDHTLFWAWTAEIVHQLTRNIKLFNSDITHFFGLLVHANLSSLGRAPRDARDMNINSAIRLLVDNHVEAVITEIHTLSAGFAFSLLEKLVRKKCGEYVKENGEIKKDFKIKNRLYKQGEIISNLAHELQLLEKIANKNLKEKLQMFKEMLRKADEKISKDAYTILKEWRNTLLHGERLFSTTTGIVTNLICLILLNEIPNDLYETKRKEIEKTVEWNLRTGMPRAHWSFYPP